MLMEMCDGKVVRRLRESVGWDLLRVVRSDAVNLCSEFVRNEYRKLGFFHRKKV